MINYNAQEGRRQNEQTMAELNSDDKTITVEMNIRGEKKAMSFVLSMPGSLPLANVQGDPRLNDDERLVKLVELFVCGNIPGLVSSTPLNFLRIFQCIQVFRGIITQEEAEKEIRRLEVLETYNKKIQDLQNNLEDEFRRDVVDLGMKYTNRKDQELIELQKAMDNELQSAEVATETSST